MLKLPWASPRQSVTLSFSQLSKKLTSCSIFELQAKSKEPGLSCLTAPWQGLQKQSGLCADKWFMAAMSLPGECQPWVSPLMYCCCIFPSSSPARQNAQFTFWWGFIFVFSFSWHSKLWKICTCFEVQFHWNWLVSNIAVCWAEDRCVSPLYVGSCHSLWWLYGPVELSWFHKIGRIQFTVICFGTSCKQWISLVSCANQSASCCAVMHCSAAEQCTAWAMGALQLEFLWQDNSLCLQFPGKAGKHSCRRMSMGCSWNERSTWCHRKNKPFTNVSPDRSDAETALRIKIIILHAVSPSSAFI